MILPFVLFAIWSSCFALGKMALNFSTPLFFTGSRMLLASLLILGYLFIKKKSQLKFSKKQIIPIGILAILSMYLTNALEFYGLQHLSAAKTCFIYSLTPFFAAFFSYLHFKEKMNFKKWLGMIIGFVGIVPVFFIQTGNESLTKSFFLISLPELAIIGATLFSVYGWVLLRILVKDNSLSPLTANGWSMLLGGILALTHSYFFDTWSPIPVASANAFGFLKSLFLITFVSNVLCYNLYGHLLKRFTATFMSFVGLLSPIFASLSEWILLKTSPSPIILLSTSVVLLGLWIVYQEELKQGYITKKAKQVSSSS
ncbi:MAG: EamA family transporter [Parachlamydiales bacterium]|nr:EamA family transporter [Parachlamydiales bacterium]